MAIKIEDLIEAYHLGRASGMVDINNMLQHRWDDELNVDLELFDLIDGLVNDAYCMANRRALQKAGKESTSMSQGKEE